MNRSRSIRVAVLALLVVTLFGSCSSHAPYKQVSLKPAADETPGAVSPPEPGALHVAVAAILSPQATSQGYDRLVAYLEARLGRPVQLAQRGTYAETNELVRTRQVDLAFVCTGAYVQGNKEFGMELLAVPQVGGASTYQSYIIVPATSAVQSLDDLRGRVFAFTDPLSLSGYLVPLYLLMSENKGSPDTYFSRTLFTYSHENSVKAVAEGWVDGAAVDSLVYEAVVAQKPEYSQRLRVIWRSEPYGAPPAVVHPSLDSATKEQLRQVLLAMDKSEQGRDALIPLGVDRFAQGDDSLYDSARTVFNAVGGSR